jgi:hypothetical protein
MCARAAVAAVLILTSAESPASRACFPGRLDEVAAEDARIDSERRTARAETYDAR